MNALNSPVARGPSAPPVFVPKAEVADPRARKQSALLSLGRKTPATSSAQLAGDVVQLVGKTLDASLCALVEVQQTEAGLVLGATVVDSVEASHDTPPAGSPCAERSVVGSALALRSPLAIEDLPNDERWDDAWLRNQAVRGLLALPLLIHERALGVLLVGGDKPRAFDEEDQEFAELVGHLVSANLARLQAEEAARNERDYAEALLDGSPAIVATMNTAGRVLRVNRTCGAVTGCDTSDFHGQPFWSALCVPTEARLVQASFGQLSADITAVELESQLLTHDGERRNIAWRLCYVVDPRDQAPSVVATGVDVTKQRQAEGEAKQAIAAAEAARRLVEELRSAPARPAALGSIGNSPAAAALETLKQMPEPKGAERRQAPRKLFPYQQWVAPLINGNVPARDQFTAVRCWDISAGGISFLLDAQPHYDNVVVVLGSEASEMLMAARIVRVTEIEQDNAIAYLIGCRFLGRL